MFRQYSKSSDQFKTNFSVGEILSFPGATFNHVGHLETFFKVAKAQTSDEDYCGQINIIILGSNDHREISRLPASTYYSALGQFSHKVNTFVDKMLSIDQSILILATTVIPYQFINPDMKIIVSQTIRYSVL